MYRCQAPQAGSRWLFALRHEVTIDSRFI